MADFQHYRDLVDRLSAYSAEHQCNGGITAEAVSYTHLDVYKRQALEHGHVECITVARCKAIRLTKEGTCHILSLIHI